MLKGCEECGCQLGATPVSMSARRDTASVSMNPRFWHWRGKASFLTTNSQIEPHSVGALFVCKNCLHDSFRFLLSSIHTQTVSTQTRLSARTFPLAYPITPPIIYSFNPNTKNLSIPQKIPARINLYAIIET